jgi:hypothetical protein
MIWKGTHLSIYGPTVDGACQKQKQAIRFKELSVELRGRVVLNHRSGELYRKMSAALKVPKHTVASIILNWKKFGTTKTLPRAGHPAKLSNRRRRNPMVTLTEPQSSSVEMVFLLEGSPISAALHQSGLHGSGQTEATPQ